MSDNFNFTVIDLPRIAATAASRNRPVTEMIATAVKAAYTEVPVTVDGDTFTIELGKRERRQIVGAAGEASRQLMRGAQIEERFNEAARVMKNAREALVLELYSIVVTRPDEIVAELVAAVVPDDVAPKVQADLNRRYRRLEKRQGTINHRAERYRHLYEQVRDHDGISPIAQPDKAMSPDIERMLAAVNAAIPAVRETRGALTEARQVESQLMAAFEAVVSGIVSPKVNALLAERATAAAEARARALVAEADAAFNAADEAVQKLQSEKADVDDQIAVATEAVDEAQAMLAAFPDEEDATDMVTAANSALQTLQDRAAQLEDELTAAKEVFEAAIANCQAVDAEVKGVIDVLA